MPGISGLKILANMTLHNYKTPFIILSSIDDKNSIIRALDYGAKRYVLKPINREIILQKIEEVLNARI